AVLAVGDAPDQPVERAADQTERGVRAARQDFWEEAEFRWRKALAIEPGNARALNNLAVRHERLGRFADAKDHYERALEAAEGTAAYDVIRDNYEEFLPIWRRVQSDEIDSDADDGDAEAATAMAAPERAEETEPADTGQASESAAPPGIESYEVEIDVPGEEGPNLGGYERLLIGNFLRREGSEANINDLAVQYLRRRITQRTYYQTQDQLGQPLEGQSSEILEDADLWARRATEAGADLILTGALGLSTEEESRMVRERVRSPDGEIREVARFRDSVVYTVQLDWLLLRGEDGERLLDGSLEAQRAFPADEGISDSEATVEVLEELLPQILETITPSRTEQTRRLIH
ncbi:MAG: tetratricopeptide repeat protein, partial [Acidobacteriota bacterium]